MPNAHKKDIDTGQLKVSVGSIITAIVLSLGVLGIIAAITLKPSTLDTLHVNPWGLGVAVLTLAMRVLLGTWRLHYVSQGRLTWSGALRAQLAWDFFSNITPSTIGGGPITPAYIARDSRIQLGEATSLMLFAMLLDQIWFACAIVLLFGSGLYIDIVPAHLGVIGNITFTLYFAGFLLWVTIFGYATLVRPRLLQHIVDRLFRVTWLQRFRERALGMMDQLQQRARILRTQHLRFYLTGFLLTIFVWLSRYMLVVAILWSVYPGIDQLRVLLRTIAMMLGALIIPTPGGTGGIEGLYALMIGPLMPETLVAPTLLAWRLLGYYIFIAIGAYLTIHQIEKSRQRRKTSPKN